jgi:hypothetical protein
LFIIVSNCLLDEFLKTAHFCSVFPIQDPSSSTSFRHISWLSFYDQHRSELSSLCELLASVLAAINSLCRKEMRVLSKINSYYFSICSVDTMISTSQKAWRPSDESVTNSILLLPIHHPFFDCWCWWND